jgi:hypothetical protein
MDGRAVTEDSLSTEIDARQDEIFGRIVIRRRCLAIDLLRIPAGDLAAEVSAETGIGAVKLETLLKGLRRYAGGSV